MVSCEPSHLHFGAKFWMLLLSSLLFTFHLSFLWSSCFFSSSSTLTLLFVLLLFVQDDKLIDAVMLLLPFEIPSEWPQPISKPPKYRTWSTHLYDRPSPCISRSVVCSDQSSPDHQSPDHLSALPIPCIFFSYFFFWKFHMLLCIILILHFTSMNVVLSPRCFRYVGTFLAIISLLPSRLDLFLKVPVLLIALTVLDVLKSKTMPLYVRVARYDRRFFQWRYDRWATGSLDRSFRAFLISPLPYPNYQRSKNFTSITFECLFQFKDDLKPFLC